MKNTVNLPRIGVMFDRDQRPEELPAFALAAEEAGADDLWVIEDLAWAGAISSAALALAATERLRVGIGIMPAPLRNPALLAMEVATLARVFPGRLVAGVGHGVAEWMDQVGAGSPRKLALLGETITAVRTLLAAETARIDGRAVRVDGVRLVHPPAEAPPVAAGVVRPQSLAVSGRVADGTILSEGHGPRGLAAALEHIAKGRAEAATDRPHEVIAFTYLCVSDSAERIAELCDPIVTGTAEWLGIPAAEVFMATGDAPATARHIRTLGEAGADTVVLRPVGDNPLSQLHATLTALRAEA